MGGLVTVQSKHAMGNQGKCIYLMEAESILINLASLNDAEFENLWTFDGGEKN